MRKMQTDSRPTAEHMFNRDLNNYKPFRSASAKREAKRRSYKAHKGSYQCPAEVPISHHPIRKDLLPIGRRAAKTRSFG